MTQRTNVPLKTLLHLVGLGLDGEVLRPAALAVHDAGIDAVLWMESQMANQ
jgi:hypothetical protein